MKVTISFEIDVDEQEWGRQYPDDMTDLPAAASRYAANVVEGLWYDLGLAHDSGRVNGKVDA